MTLRGSTLASNMFTYHQRLDVQKLVKVHARLEVEKQNQDIKNRMNKQKDKLKSWEVEPRRF